MTLALAVLPIFLLLVAGYALANSGIVGRDRWADVELFCFRVLIPAMLIQALIRADLSPELIGPLAASLVLAIVTFGLLVLTLRFIVSQERLPNPQFTTVFQTATRWNAFIAFAASDQIVGLEGRGLIAVGVAVLIPLINVGNIVVLSVFGPGQPTPGRILRTVFTNPLVIGCLIGLTLNITGLPLGAPVEAALSITADGALGVGLLAVGAGVSLSRIFASSGAMWAGVGLRILCAPVVFLLVSQGFTLTPTQTFLGALMLLVPAASNGYIVAKQMGGDADLYADILTWQIALSLIAIPVLAAILL